MDLSRALEIVAATNEEELRAFARYYEDSGVMARRFDDGDWQHHSTAAAVLTLVLHGRESGAFGTAADEVDWMGEEYERLMRALSGETDE